MKSGSEADSSAAESQEAIILLKSLYIKLELPFVQYLVGVFINVLYVIILISNDTSYQNLQLPEGIYSNNLWKGGDVVTYVYPSRNFVDFQVFGSGTVPDYHRTVGYPLFLSALMILFGDNWITLVFFIQALIFAAIYPMLYRTSNFLFNEHKDAGIFSFIFFLASGTYIAVVPVIMTDLFFSVFFTVGLYFGFESVIRNSWICLLLHILCMGYAAQVRPVLALYPIIEFFILIYLSKKHQGFVSAKAYTFSILTALLLIILCNISSVRNYINYGFISPSDVFSNALFTCLASDVLKKSGNLDQYNMLYKDIQAITNVNKRTQVQQELALNIYREYPLTTLTQIMKNAIGIMLRSHWSIVANFWGYSFVDNLDRAMPLKKSNIIFAIESLFNIIYLFIYVLFFAFLIRHFILKNYAFSFVILLLVSYLLIPTFLCGGAGSRYRLPVEGIIVLASFSELKYRLEAWNNIRRASRNDIAI